MMKKNLLRMVAAMLMLCCAADVQAAGDEVNGHAYFTKAELPDMTKILPPFPEFESARFVADQSQHLWGKLMRQDEARAAQAQSDAVYSMQTAIDAYSPLFGLEISKEGTPEIYSILQDVCASCDSIYFRRQGQVQPPASLRLLRRGNADSREGGEAPL